MSQRTWYTSLVMAPLSGTTWSARQSATSAHAAASSCSSSHASLGIRGPAAGTASAAAARATWLWFSIATILAKFPARSEASREKRKGDWAISYGNYFLL